MSTEGIDKALIRLAYAYEQVTKHRVKPNL